MIYTHVLKSAAAGTASPLDALMDGALAGAASFPSSSSALAASWPSPLRHAGGGDGDGDDGDGDDLGARHRHQVREPWSSYRVTPSCTAAATSAS
jgi:hypothetical protein